MRDGVPLPGVSPAQVVAQLTRRVFGPLHLDGARVVLDYHGLGGAAAGTIAEVAARHGVTTRTVSLHVQAIRAEGSTLPLTPAVITEATPDPPRPRITSPGSGSPAPSHSPHPTGRHRRLLTRLR